MNRTLITEMKWLLVALIPSICLADAVVPIDQVKNSVNIRLSPDATSDVVGKLYQGSSVERVNSIDGWHEVQLAGGATGFISADWTLVLADEATVEEAGEETVEASVKATVSEDSVAETVEAVEAVAEEVIADAVVEENVVEEFVDEEIVVEEDAVKKDVEVVEPSAVTPTDDSLSIKGTKNFLVRFRDESSGGNSQVFDNGNQIGIGTTTPKQRLEVNGSIQIHEQSSSVAGLMITQSSGDTGYIMHNRASTLTIGAGSQDRMTIDRDGNVGIAVARPKHPFEMASGAHVTAGGVWTNASSRDRKENIVSLNAREAELALMALEPVVFNYLNEVDEEYVGFIAEDVPDLVAVGDRDGLSTMDIVAVLTRVVQEQQSKIKELEDRLDGQH